MRLDAPNTRVRLSNSFRKADSSIRTPAAPGKHCWVFCSQHLGQSQDQLSSLYGAAVPKLLSSIQTRQGRRDLASQ